MTWIKLSATGSAISQSTTTKIYVTLSSSGVPLAEQVGDAMALVITHHHELQRSKLLIAGERTSLERTTPRGVIVSWPLTIN